MRAVQIVDLTGPDTALALGDIPEPESPPQHPLTPGSGVLVEVHVAGVSFPEVLQTRGEYQLKPPLPFVPGSEIAGIVREAPDGAAVAPGDRVAAFCALGGFAELAVAPEFLTFPLSSQLDYARGAGLILNYHTAYFALVLRGRLVAGETVLVHGAAGGVDIVLDPVGGDRFTDSLRSLRETGRIVVVGFTGGSIPEVRVNRLLLGNTEVIGAGWGAYAMARPEVCRDIDLALKPLIESGVLAPIVGARFPLDRAAEALHEIDERRALGKVVLDVRPD